MIRENEGLATPFAITSSTDNLEGLSLCSIVTPDSRCSTVRNMWKCSCCLEIPAFLAGKIEWKVEDIDEGFGE